MLYILVFIISMVLGLFLGHTVGYNQCFDKIIEILNNLNHQYANNKDYIKDDSEFDKTLGKLDCINDILKKVGKM